MSLLLEISLVRDYGPCSTYFHLLNYHVIGLQLKELHWVIYISLLGPGVFLGPRLKKLISEYSVLFFII